METPTPFSIEAYNELVRDKQSHIVQRHLGITKDNGRIVCTDYMRYGEPEVIFITNSATHQEPWTFTINGKATSTVDKDARLVIVPKPPVSLGWVVVYMASNYIEPQITQLWDTAQQAIDFCGYCPMLSEPIQIFAKP